MTRQLLEIVDIGSQGEGVGKKGGIVYFIQGALPGETVEVILESTGEKIARGKISSLVKSAIDRRVPKCPHFEKCGGCQLQHLTYQSQLDYKKKRIEEALKRIGKFESLIVEDCIPSIQEFHYRNKIQLPHVAGEFGLYAKKSHQQIPIKTCFLHVSLGEEVFQTVKGLKTPPSLKFLLIKTAVSTKEVLVTLVAEELTKEIKEFARQIFSSHEAIRGVVFSKKPKQSNRILGEEMVLLEGESSIQEIILGLTFKISSDSFFQVNPFQVEFLYKKALERLDIQPHHQIYDAYCGVGTLTLFAAKKGKKAIGSEIVKRAIADAKENAAYNGIVNALFIEGAAENIIESLENIDRAIINPPRSGCNPNVIKALLEKPVERIVYISCDPATLARDLQFLEAKYKIEFVEPFDLFPQTVHVETVVTLQKK